MTRAQKIELALSNTSSPLLASLAIPHQVCSDGPAGVRGGEGTAFPVPIALAATFDPILAREVAAAIAREVRAAGRTTWLGLCTDIARTPQSGRCAETLGEDPLLAAAIAAAEVSGARDEHVLTMAKHFVAYNQERWRVGHATGESELRRDDAINVVVSERALREIYLPPVAAAIRAGVGAIMGSYNRVNGEYACQSASLLAMLKDELGLDGFVAPDFGHAVRDAILAANAGLDRPTLDDDAPGALSRASFESGAIREERLDDICRRVLFALADSGLVDHPATFERSGRATPLEHRELARRAAVASMVLLKNDGVLPLDSGHGSIALIGAAGHDAIRVVGGSAAVTIAPERSTTPIEAIRARAGMTVSVTHAQGSLGDVPLSPIAAHFFGDPAGSGLTAEYFANASYAGPALLTRSESMVDLTAPPIDLGSAWSARWTGTMHPPDTGIYRLSLLLSGGAELYLDGDLVLYGEREAAHFIEGPLLPLQGEVELHGGLAVDIRLEYSTAAAVFPPRLTLGWQTPGESLIDGAAEAAAFAAATVVFVTSAEGEGMDRAGLALAGDQDRLIRAVAASDPATVVVINSGGPVLMPWIDQVSAVIQVWYPGEQYGEALADVLFGDADPGGRLPITFPADESQGPQARSDSRYPGIDRVVRYDEENLVGYRWFDAVEAAPQFPFGHGLSYAAFTLVDPNLERRADGVVVASVEVVNSASRPGVAVVQIYAEPPVGAGPRALKGFAKLEVGPASTRRAAVELPRDALAHYEADVGWVIPAGRHLFWVGESSRDLQPLGTVTVASTQVAPF
jgi:beta-glucosidase